MNLFEHDQPLFGAGDLQATLEGQRTKLKGEVEAYDQGKLLNTAPEDLANYLVKKYQVEPLQLQRQRVQVTRTESRVDVSRDRDRHISDPSQPFYMPATLITFHVPFEGEADLFRLRPSSFNFNPPSGTVSNGELRVAFSITEGGDPKQVKDHFEHQMRSIEQYVASIARDTSAFNASLKAEALTSIERRRKRLLESHNLVAELGYPLRERPDSPQTYAVPDVRRKVVPAPPSAPSAPYAPEPALDLETYEHILEVIQNMVLVMERSPSAFATMTEPDLRNHFLVQLNGQYEGAATGETFNYEGKTDILIRVNGKNIFIGECKFWDGPASLTDAIDQVLGYASWRDTKVAVVLFNRRFGFSEVVAKIPDVLKGHPNFKRDMTRIGETSFRAIFRHRDDPNREMMLTVAAFDIPTVAPAERVPPPIRAKKGKKE